MNANAVADAPTPGEGRRDRWSKTAPGRGLLDAILAADGTARTATPGPLEEFLREPSLERALARWFSGVKQAPVPATKHQLAQSLVQDIARLDALLSRQVNAILHHPGFQKLEASWRGLHYLVGQVPEGENIKICVLNVSWKELARDVERALEFDQSQLFRKVYEEEFGTAGGEPYSVLLGDFEIRPRPGPDHPIDDLMVLVSIASVAAAAFAPFIAGAHPSVLDLGSFTDLERPLNLPKTFEQAEFLKWRALRRMEDTRFVGLTLPRVLRRRPYAEDGRGDGFRFREEVGDPDRHEYLWGSAVYAFGAVLVRAFAESGWLADIRGAPRGDLGGGVVTGLPAHSFGTDKAGIAPMAATDALIPDALEKELGDLGFIPLCHCPDTDRAVFYGNQSVQRPPKFDEAAATTNAKLSTMLQYMLCVARFAHYLKVIARDKIGSFTGPEECETYLTRWVFQYITSNDQVGVETKARYPLREAQVQIREHPRKPGSYVCVIHLRPHFQLDEVVTAVRLATELAPTPPR